MKWMNATLYSLVFGLLASCATAPKVVKVTSLVPVSETDRKVTKSGVTVEVVPITLTNLGEHPQLTTTAKIMGKDFLESQPSPKDRQITNVLLGLPFALKVTNNTAHILKMAGSEIGLSVGGQDVRKLDKEQIKQLWVAYFAKEHKYQVGLPAELGYAIDRASYWDETARILPGKSMTCYAAFEVDLREGIGQATLAIYDLVTDTDEAGNPTERTNFDFNLKELTTETTSQ